MTAIRAVCFDLDDTLFDYREYARAGLGSAADRLEARTGRRLHDELLAMYFEEGLTNGTFDRLLERHDLSPELTAEMVEAYHAAKTPLSPYEGTVALLSALAEDYELGLLTDGRGGHAKLRRLGIHDQFDAVLVTPTIGSSKRDPEVFEILLAEMSVSPEAAAYVGDDPRFDTRGPNELGMTTVRLRRGRHADREPVSEAATPDYDVDTLEGVQRCLSALAARH